MRFLNPKKTNTVKGIMFKEPLFNAIISGNKTQTRRVVKVDPKEEIITEVHNGDNPMVLVESDIKQRVIYPRYEIGETVYLKEPYCAVPSGEYDYKPTYLYKFRDGEKGFKYKNKMFMPERAARYFIKITNIRVERLQDITRSDIRREGLICPEELCSDEVSPNYKDWYPAEWQRLWDSINKHPFAWEDNPLNWVYEFELTEKTK